jgi:hypothetical protein
MTLLDLQYARFSIRQALDKNLKRSRLCGLHLAKDADRLTSRTHVAWADLCVAHLTAHSSLAACFNAVPPKAA